MLSIAEHNYFNNIKAIFNTVEYKDECQMREIDGIKQLCRVSNIFSGTYFFKDFLEEFIRDLTSDKTVLYNVSCISLEIFEKLDIQKVSPELVKKTMDMLCFFESDKINLYLKYLEKSILNQEIKSVLSLIRYPLHYYRHVRDGEEHDYVFNQVSQLIKQAVKTFPNHKNEIKKAFIEHMNKSNTECMHLTNKQLIQEYKSIFEDNQINEFLKALGKEEIQELFTKSPVQNLLMFNVDKDNLTYFLDNVPLEKLCEMVNKLNNFPKMYVVNLNEKFYMMGVENIGPHSVQKVQALIELMIRENYQLKNDTLSSVVLNINLEFSLEKKEVKSAKMKI